MAARSDNFDDSQDLPDWERTKKNDQGKALTLDEQVKRLIKEFNDTEVTWMLRELRGSAGDEAQDILYQGLDRLWRYRKRYIGFDSTVTDVKNLMWKICRNLVRDQHRRKKLKQLPLIWKTKDEDGNAIEKELVYLDGFEDAVCQRMYYRDVMAEVLKHFKNEEDRRCIYLMMRELKPREIAEEITGDAAKADQYRKRCERIKARIKVLLNKMGIWREEF